MMTPKQFAEYYDMREDTVRVFMHYNKGAKFIKEGKEGKLIDDVWLESIRNAKRALWHTAHDHYYMLESFGLSDYDQAKLISGVTKSKLDPWTSFISHDLFRSDNNNITNLRHKHLFYTYIRATSAIIQIINRHGADKINAIGEKAIKNDKVKKSVV